MQEELVLAGLFFLLALAALAAKRWLTTRWQHLQKQAAAQRHGDGSADGEAAVALLERQQQQGKLLSVRDVAWSNRLTLFVNGSKMEIVNPDPSTLLAHFIRNTAGLKGTKLGCEEGGCGACTVALTAADGTAAVNSCLRPLCANDGHSITTVEGLGSVATGLSEEQRRLVANNGTQCGFCSPGWVTNMHALRESAAESGKSLTKREIENYFDGNICRCTGYRPIMQAFGSFAHEHPHFPQEEGGFLKVPYQSRPQCSNGNSNGNGSAQRQAHECAGLCAPKDQCQGGSCMDIEGPGCRNNCFAAQVTVKPKRAGGSGSASEANAAVRSYVAQPLLFFNPVTGKRWYRPLTVEQLGAILREHDGSAVQLVGGNTSIGVTKYLNNTAPYFTPDEYSVFVDVNSIPSMSLVQFNASLRELTVGATVTINQLIALLQEHSLSTKSKSSSASQDHVSQHSGEVDHHSLFSVVAHHLTMLGNNQVRNAGTWAGNLMIFLKYTSFPSDVVLALTTAQAKIHLCNKSGHMSSVTMEQFMNLSYDDFVAQGTFILSLTLAEPVAVPLVDEVISETFKIAQRAKNAHPHVNAGFSFHIKRTPAGILCRSARLVFGGVSQKTFVATNAQTVLKNAYINQATLATALAALDVDLSNVGPSDAYGDQTFRYSLMQTCFYRALLRCFPIHELPSYLTSAVLPWVKPESRGTEVFVPSSKDQGAVGKPVRKLEAQIQATGEAVYPSDEPMPAQGLYAAIVYSSRCAVTLSAIDSSPALAIAGVVAVYTATDVPGNNSVGSNLYLFVPLGQTVPYVGAPLAVVVASSEEVANQAAAAVAVTYLDSNSTPIVDIDTAIAKNSYFKIPSVLPSLTQISRGNATKVLQSASNRVQGHVYAGGQAHFYMETQTAVANFVDGEYIDVVCGTQDPTGYQQAIADNLSLDQNKVIVKCPRTGGAFGGKITRGITVAASAALCAAKLRRPVRIFNSRNADMNMTSGRESFDFDYDVSFDADGTITALSYQFYMDAGTAYSDSLGSLYMSMNWADNAYYFPNYLAKAKVCQTNTPARTSVRAPGVVQSCLATEIVVERVAKELGLPTKTVQEKNFIQNGESTISGQTVDNCVLSTVWNTLVQRSKYDLRYAQINDYNARNLWRKRGISICPVKYGIGWSGYNAGVRIGVRQADGTITLAHSGSEIGQGINTKAAQAVASALGVDLSLIRVTATATDKVVNGGVTGGSGTSEVIVQAALNACAELNARLDPYRTASSASVSANRSSSRRGSTMSTADWVTLLSGLPSDVSLNVEGWYSPTANPNGQLFQYFVYAACVAEVELDVLSGQVHVLSSEIVYDCGQSLNPAVDIGQIEGGVVMQLGYLLTERVDWGSDGTLVTQGTWEYKPPLASDIPSVMTVTLLRNDSNSQGILGSKATAEPSMVIANSVYFAVKMAIASARYDATGSNAFFQLDVPATVNLRQEACLPTATRFVMPC